LLSIVKEYMCTLPYTEFMTGSKQVLVEYYGLNWVKKRCVKKILKSSGEFYVVGKL